MIEINKLIESDIDQIREIGWLFYNSDIDKGLNEDDTYRVIKLLSEIKVEENSEKELEDAFDEGYDEGYHDGKNSVINSNKIDKKHLETIIKDITVND